MRVIKIKRTININAQNSRKSNMEIAGIPKEILQMKLEEAVINLFNNLPEPVAYTTDDIEAVHRIAMNSDMTIVKVKSLKLVKKVNSQKIGLKRNTKILTRNCFQLVG